MVAAAAVVEGVTVAVAVAAPSTLMWKTISIFLVFDQSVKERGTDGRSNGRKNPLR